MSAFDNLEYELYAPLTLIHSFPQFVKSLSKGERPDWQDIAHGIGIEVARAEDNHIGYSKYFWNKYHGKDKGDIPAYELSRFKGHLVFDGNKLSSLSPYKKDSFDVESCDNSVYRIGLIDSNTHIQLARKITSQKIQLLNSKSFLKFNKNCLYLYMTLSLSEDDSHNFLKWYTVAFKNYQIVFNHVFLMSFDEIYHLDLNNEIIQSYVFSKKELEYFDHSVHKLRMKSTWGDGTQFSIS